MYRSEAAFSEALCKLLSQRGIFHQRIESRLTGCGIPDLYIRLKESEHWVELKNMPRDFVTQKQWEIPWRKGQRAWMYNYGRISGIPAYTYVAMYDGFLAIDMRQLYTRNVVKKTDHVYIASELKDILEVFRIDTLLN